MAPPASEEEGAYKSEEVSPVDDVEWVEEVVQERELPDVPQDVPHLLRGERFRGWGVGFPTRGCTPGYRAPVFAGVRLSAPMPPLKYANCPDRVSVENYGSVEQG